MPSEIALLVEYVCDARPPSFPAARSAAPCSSTLALAASLKRPNQLSILFWPLQSSLMLAHPSRRPFSAS
jgi:hypothetical protein